MINRKSRYAKTPTFTATDATGAELTLLALREPPAVAGVFFHTPEAGERLDHLANRYYRDPTAFWRICDGSDVMDPFDVITPGRPVRIPAVR
ncbi:MAG: hypothetical protein JWM10_364 [Myxococcaceae bacterium]|nr:hypothetical protein [Myxococcaceae bacterium]